MSEIKWSDPTYFTDMHALSMTLRDYFAAKAMTMMSDYSAELGAIEAYKWADAMLKERSK